MFAINMLLVLATLLLAGALWLYTRYEDEEEFPCLYNKEDEEWYDRYRKGLRK